ncbi:UDP-3-O-(3-hydroxymyristoyl)glucosamine N-acyltransferase [Pseudanabaena sp. UWO310]|uniref:UDP-3-O-(3-hydroxymyristoyl)glucosamine N-acyltransferase n=1 Tax=Pseudanabaena sp. UWO310 TaxID=2480795 RepID=UPI001CC1C5FC|nr:UDP-3-O-(3-hydroxymyristoyl)glucosamine N-acyltransferase [Pseudanabaena sp. UWO310]
MTPMISFKLSELASELATVLPDCRFESDGDDPIITGVAAIDKAQAGEITFVSSSKFVSKLKDTQASAVILDQKTPSTLPCIRTTNPRILFAKVLEKFYQPPIAPLGIHPTAILGEGVQLGENAAIGAYAVIGDRTKIADNVTIFPHVTIYNDVEIGIGTTIHANCVIRDRTQVGANCIFHPNAVLGADGFGFELSPDATWYKIPQTGYVIIEDNVELGCSCAVDRPSVGVTIIHKGAKLDNFVQIAHGVRVGAHSVLAAQVGLAGGVTLGHHVVMAGQVGANDRVHVGDGAIIGGKAGITSDVPAGASMIGFPTVPEKSWKRVVIAERQLPDLLHTVRKLEKRIAELESKLAE